MAEYESTKPQNPFTSIISKFTEFIANFRFPPPPVKVETETKAVGNTVIPSGEVAEESKPVTVKFSDARPATVAPLKLETEEAEKDTKPVFLWQVYAIGGFFILKWAVARWKERRANNQPPPAAADEEDSPSPPPAAAADEGNE